MGELMNDSWGIHGRFMDQWELQDPENEVPKCHMFGHIL